MKTTWDDIYQIAELVRCKSDIIYFAEKYIKNCTEYDLISLNLSKEQRRILRRATQHRKYLLKSCRQFGKSTIGLIVALHTLLFGSNETIIYVSSKPQCSERATNILRNWIQFLPYWMVKEIKTHRSTFDFGGNMLWCVPATPYSVRGVTPTTIIVDELAFYDDEFWMYLYPAISARKDIKLKVFSTPKDREDIVTNLYNASQEGLNDFVTDMVTWKDTGSCSEEYMN